MSDPATQRRNETYLEPGPKVGTPDHPAFKRRPVAFVIALLAYASFVALLIVWAVKLRRGE